MKNLLILHLESISRQRLAAFAAVLPNTTRLLGEARFFDNFYASATSTLMVLGYLFHANDFEFDTASSFEGMLPDANNAHLFSLLRDRGYNSDLICLNGFQQVRPIRLRSWVEGLPPVWATHDFPTLFARFDKLTDAAPFAIYVWDLISHIEHSLALAPYSTSVTDQLRRACAVADDAVGEMRAILERKGLLDNTTIVVYGDHGDDTWTHGFKGGMIHGTEPYTDIIWTPLAIRDPGLAPGTVEDMAGTIDIAPTCLPLLGIDAKFPFPHSGVDLLHGRREFAHAQNFTANQPDNAMNGIAKAFSVTDKTHTLMASSRGLELFAHRLDPGNHCNLLHFFTLDPAGKPILKSLPNAAPHFRAAWQDNPRAADNMAAEFRRLQNVLATCVEAKRAYIVGRGIDPVNALPEACLNSISQVGRDKFFHRPNALAARMPAPAIEVTYKLR